VPEAAASALQRVRAVLSSLHGVRLDPGYRCGVRAYRIEDGRRIGLPRDAIASALEGNGSDLVRTIGGEGQTDFTARDVDKGSGLRALITQLATAESPSPPLELAVGDTREDIPFAPLARWACAPAHADASLRAHGFSVMRRPYQSGFAEATRDLIGHHPDRCEICRGPALSPEGRTLASLLGLQEQGSARMVVRALKATLRAP